MCDCCDNGELEFGVGRLLDHLRCAIHDVSYSRDSLDTIRKQLVELDERVSNLCNAVDRLADIAEIEHRAADSPYGRPWGDPGGMR